MRMSARASSDMRHAITMTPYPSPNSFPPLLLLLAPRDLRVFHRTKTPFKSHLMSPLNKWLYAAGFACDTNRSQGFPQDKDAAAFVKAHLMSPLNKWLDTATEGSDTNGSQDFPEDKDTTILEVLVPDGKGVV